MCSQSVLQSSELPLGTAISMHLTLDKEVVEQAAKQAELAVEQALREREVADSLAKVTADSLRMLNSVVEPQPEQAEDEFFF